MPLDDLFAAARRLPPDLLSSIDHVIGVPAFTLGVSLNSRGWD